MLVKSVALMATVGTGRSKGTTTTADMRFRHRRTETLSALQVANHPYTPGTATLLELQAEKIMDREKGATASKA